jgi:hypothetical protein
MVVVVVGAAVVEVVDEEVVVDDVVDVLVVEVDVVVVDVDVLVVDVDVVEGLVVVVVVPAHGGFGLITFWAMILPLQTTLVVWLFVSTVSVTDETKPAATADVMSAVVRPGRRTSNQTALEVPLFIVTGASAPQRGLARAAEIPDFTTGKTRVPVGHGLADGATDFLAITVLSTTTEIVSYFLSDMVTVDFREPYR